MDKASSDVGPCDRYQVTGPITWLAHVDMKAGRQRVSPVYVSYNVVDADIPSFLSIVTIWNSKLQLQLVFVIVIDMNVELMILVI